MTEDIYWQESEHGVLYCENLIFPDKYWPVRVMPGTIWERKAWVTSMPRKLELIGIWTFLGHGRGDIAESDINIETESGIPLVQRSDHRVFDDYDADVYYDVQKLHIKEQTLKIWLKCNPTADKPAYYHVVIRVLGLECKS